MLSRDYDVLVLGSGAAGLAAALSASESGASVLLAEGSEVVGGASRLSGGIIMGADTPWQRKAGVEDSPAAMYQYYMTVNRWNVQPACVWRLAHDAGPTIEWVAEMGVPILPDVITASDEPTPRGHAVDGQGAKLIEVLSAVVRQERRNIDLVMNRRVDRLLVDHSDVVGAAVGDDEIHTSAVVMATGGFGANGDLLAKYAPRALVSGDWRWYVGPPTSQGDALALAEQVDAPLIGYNHVGLCLRPNFSHDGEGEFPGWLVIVNGQGRRFMNEMAPYSVSEHLAYNQEGPIVAILDEAIRRDATTENVRRSKKVERPGESVGDWVGETVERMVQEGKAVKAESVGELAQLMSISPADLQSTIAVYNQGVIDGRDSLYLKNPEVMRPISTPPFYAAELRLCLVGWTFVGPQIDDEARVIGRSGKPIPGLFAAGECTGGVIGECYAGSGNSLANSLTFGRIAGSTAAKGVAA